MSNYQAVFLGDETVIEALHGEVVLNITPNDERFGGWTLERSMTPNQAREVARLLNLLAITAEFQQAAGDDVMEEGNA